MDVQIKKFKDFLNANPLDIIYELAAYSIEDYQTLTIRSYPNHTFIESTEEVKPLLHSELNRHEALIDEIQNSNICYTKAETDSLLESKQNKVLHGSTDPAASLGADGDLYVKV